MKPYKIHNTWVDLDHVLAIDDQPVVPRGEFEVYGYAIMMFRDSPLCICLGNPDWVNDEFGREATKKVPSTKSIQEWEAFKTAWMNKDKQPT